MKIIFLLFPLGMATDSLAQPRNEPSKKWFNLFHPAPNELMRSFEKDRPDVTESAYTVDAGHFQLETDLFKTLRSTADATQTIDHSFNTANLKLGITNSLDLQFVIATWVITEIKKENRTYKQSGFGGLTLRAKQNLWGNEKGKSALAVLPYVNIPTRSAEKISGGITFPFAVPLSNGWDFGAEIQTAAFPNQKGNNYHFNYLVSATGSHALFKNLDFFAEGVATRDNEAKRYEFFFNAGAVFSIKKNWDIDCGVYYGLKKISPKAYFIGLSFRI